LKAEVFFSRITNPTTIEDALDDVVDGLVQVAVAPQLALEKYKRRKPARFAHLKELMHSPAFPAPVVVYQEGAIDQATLVRFQDGLLNAHKKQQGQMLLNLFKLTKYEKPPADYDRVVAETGKAFPPPNREGK